MRKLQFTIGDGAGCTEELTLSKGAALALLK